MNCICPDDSVIYYTKTCPLSCPDISYTDGTKSSTECNCKTGFNWDSTQNKCVIDCTLITYATTLVSGTID